MDRNVLAAVEKQRLAHATWEEGEPIAGTRAERYLREKRKITTLPPNVDDVLRYHPYCPFRRWYAPCLIALFRDVETDVPTALHRTNIDLQASAWRSAQLRARQSSSGQDRLTASS